MDPRPISYIRTTTVTKFNNRNILLAKKHLSLSRIPYSGFVGKKNKIKTKEFNSWIK